ncbi:MAG TPA: hypothetical protein VFR02_08470, partial [bacterium]|nr:hypothetical protein [bacterium]
MRSHPLPTAAFPELVPLARGVFETAFPWMERWGPLASRGAAVFLESAGPLEDAGRWCLLAGDPAAELDGRSFPGGPDAVLEFLDAVTQGPPAPFPEGLSRAWFGA